MKFFLVFLGGGLGSALRYGISKFLNIPGNMPYGTFFVNVIGSLLLGIMIGYFMKNNSVNSYNQSLFLVTGFCGGFTTFSAFAFENNTFLKNGEFLNFFGYTLLSLVFGIMAVFLGLFLSKYINLSSI
jgi:CrcB protein